MRMYILFPGEPALLAHCCRFTCFAVSPMILLDSPNRKTSKGGRGRNFREDVRGEEHEGERQRSNAVDNLFGDQLVPLSIPLRNNLGF